MAEKWQGEDPRLRICEGDRGKYPNFWNLVFLRPPQYMKDTDNIVFLQYLQPWRGKHTRPSHKSSSAVQQNLELPQLSYRPLDPWKHVSCVRFGRRNEQSSTLFRIPVAAINSSNAANLSQSDRLSKSWRHGYHWPVSMLLRTTSMS